jgi:hypothetical protein
MAKTKTAIAATHRVKPKVRRKGVHAKSKTSKNKNSKNYKKPYNNQGN